MPETTPSTPETTLSIEARKDNLIDRLNDLPNMAEAYFALADTEEQRERLLEVTRMTLRLFARESQLAIGTGDCPSPWVQCSDGSCALPGAC